VGAVFNRDFGRREPLLVADAIRSHPECPHGLSQDLNRPKVVIEALFSTEKRRVGGLW
jgi:hypothetical protein